MIKQIFALSFFFFSQAFAVSNYPWGGTGEIELNYSTHSRKVLCPNVDFNISRNESKLYWKNFNMRCINSTGGTTELDYSGFEFDVVNNEIFYQGESVGSINRESFSFRIYQLGEEALFTLSGKKVGDALILTMEEFFDAEGAYFKYSFVLR